MGLLNKLGYIKGAKVAIQDGGSDKDWIKFPVNGSVVKAGKDDYKFSLTLDYDNMLKIDILLTVEALDNMLVALDDKIQQDWEKRQIPFSEERKKILAKWDCYDEPWW